MRRNGKKQKETEKSVPALSSAMIQLLLVVIEEIQEKLVRIV